MNELPADYPFDPTDTFRGDVWGYMPCVWEAPPQVAPKSAESRPGGYVDLKTFFRLPPSSEGVAWLWRILLFYCDGHGTRTLWNYKAGGGTVDRETQLLAAAEGGWIRYRSESRGAWESWRVVGTFNTSALNAYSAANGKPPLGWEL